MADEFDALTIDELINRFGGEIKTGPFGTRLKAAQYTETGVPLISVGEVARGRIVIHATTPRVDASITDEMPEYVLRTGDIVFGRKGGVDRNAIVTSDQHGWFLGSDGIRLRLSGGVSNEFIAYHLMSRETQEWLKQHAGGTTMPSLNQKIIGRIPLRLPPLAEQKAIANVLKSLDDKIELDRRMNETLEAMARAIFKSWFVDFDPVRAKAEGREPEGMDAETAACFPDHFVDSPLGKIPAGWEVVELERVVGLIIDYRGKTPKKLGADWSQKGIPAISAKNIKKGRLVRLESANFVSEPLYDKWMKDKLRQNDIVLTSEAPLGELYYLAAR